MKNVGLIVCVILLTTRSFAQQPVSKDELYKYHTYTHIPELTEADSVYKILVQNPGALPGYIGLFTHLQELRIIGNDWDWNFKSLPDSFYLLKNLSILSIQNTDLDTISPLISKLSNLSKLELAQNKITQLPASMKELYQLKELSINVLKEIPELEYLETLRLYLYNDTVKLPQGFEKLLKLKKLSISTANSIYDPLLLKSQLEQLTQLEEFEFENPNRYGSGEDDILISALATMPKLKKLKLNGLTIKSSTIKTLKKIEYLSITALQCLGDPSTKTCYTQFALLPALKDYSTVYTRSINPYLKLFKSISLDHQEWSSTYDIDKDISSLKKAKHIQYIKLRLLPSYLDSLKNVQELDLLNVNFTFTANIFLQLVKLPKLQKLYLSNESLAGNFELLGTLKQLKALEINNYNDGSYNPLSWDNKQKLQKLLPLCVIQYNE